MTKITIEFGKGAEVTDNNNTTKSCNSTQSNSPSSSSFDANIKHNSNPENKFCSENDSIRSKSIRNKSKQISSDYNLRPKFTILKHKTEIINGKTVNQSGSNENSANAQVVYNKQKPVTPSWFFNIPDTRSPFPNFESKLPPEDKPHE